ncbi:MAG TPA: glycosyltransferase, partial [Bryobacteraceae bacterium]|nr:glycosyltransferase [Bryobacteraceae bacterium]
MRFGIITPPVPGHIHPFGALGRELIERGHSVTVLHMADLENRVRAEGLDFVPIGQTDHPAGSLPESLAALGRLNGMAAL